MLPPTRPAGARPGRACQGLGGTRPCQPAVRAGGGGQGAGPRAVPPGRLRARPVLWVRRDDCLVDGRGAGPEPLWASLRVSAPREGPPHPRRPAGGPVGFCRAWARAGRALASRTALSAAGPAEPRARGCPRSESGAAAAAANKRLEGCDAAGRESAGRSDGARAGPRSIKPRRLYVAVGRVARPTGTLLRQAQNQPLLRMGRGWALSRLFFAAVPGTCLSLVAGLVTAGQARSALERGRRAAARSTRTAPVWPSPCWTKVGMPVVNSSTEPG